jgi:hypothetical protein
LFYEECTVVHRYTLTGEISIVDYFINSLLFCCFVVLNINGAGIVRSTLCLHLMYATSNKRDTGLERYIDSRRGTYP